MRLEPKPDLRHLAEGGITLGELRRNLALLTDDVAIINDCFLAARTVRHRLEGVGTVTTELATQIGLVGMAARASGIARDLRTTSGGIYEEHRIETCIESRGDCWARALLRIEEINRSLAWIRAGHGSLPAVAARTQPDRDSWFPDILPSR